MRGALTVGFGALVATAWLACSSDYGDDNHAGERFNACYPNHTCNAALTCIDGLCVLDGADVEGGANEGGASSSSSSSSSSGQGSTSSSSGAVVAVSFDDYFKALCSELKRCNPSLFLASFASDDECVALYKGRTVISAYPGVAVRTQARVDACADKTSKDTCAAFASGQPPECLLPGTNADDAPCNTSEQCAHGLCKKQDGSACGKCAAAVVVLKKKLGDQCAVGMDVCERGLQCIDQKCATPKELGDACGAPVECRSGLVCTDNKCAEQTYARNGEKCGPESTAFTSCSPLTYSCLKNVADSRCVHNAKEGDACSATGTASPTNPACLFGLTCTLDGKCMSTPMAAECK